MGLYRGWSYESLYGNLGCFHSIIHLRAIRPCHMTVLLVSWFIWQHCPSPMDSQICLPAPSTTHFLPLSMTSLAWYSAWVWLFNQDSNSPVCIIYGKKVGHLDMFSLCSPRIFFFLKKEEFLVFPGELPCLLHISHLTFCWNHNQTSLHFSFLSYWRVEDWVFMSNVSSSSLSADALVVSWSSWLSSFLESTWCAVKMAAAMCYLSPK